MHSSKLTIKYININTAFLPNSAQKTELSGCPNVKKADFLITLPVSIRNVVSMKLKSFNAPISTKPQATYYMLYIDDFINSDEHFYEGCYPSNNTVKNILAKITTKHAKDTNTTYEADATTSFIRNYTGSISLNKLHVRLYDNNNEIVEFQGLDDEKNFTFLLEIETFA